jgi:uncharacterized protein YkwD
MPRIPGGPSGEDRLVAGKGMSAPRPGRDASGAEGVRVEAASGPSASAASGPSPSPAPAPYPHRASERDERRRRPVLTVVAVAAGSVLAIGTGFALDRLVLTDLRAEPASSGQAAGRNAAPTADPEPGRTQPRPDAGAPAPAAPEPTRSAPPLKEIPASARPTPTPRTSESDEPGGGSSGGTGSGSSGGSSGPETTVATLTNQERAKAGCGALRIDSRLVTSARRHSQDMAANNYFDHTSRDGDSPFARMEAAGYPSPGAENIAMGYPSPAAVVEGWMNSSGHRANILNCKLRAIGVGMASSSRGPYWTQNFGF